MNPETFWGWLAFLTALTAVTAAVLWLADVIVDRHVERALEQPWDEEEWT